MEIWHSMPVSTRFDKGNPLILFCQFLTIYWNILLLFIYFFIPFVLTLTFTVIILRILSRRYLFDWYLVCCVLWYEFCAQQIYFNHPVKKSVIRPSRDHVQGWIDQLLCPFQILKMSIRVVQRLLFYCYCFVSVREHSTLHRKDDQQNLSLEIFMPNCVL